MTGSLYTTHLMESVSTQESISKPQVSCDTSPVEEEDVVYDWSTGLHERDDSALYFYPDQGNIIFASAIDGWGFRYVNVHV